MRASVRICPASSSRVLSSVVLVSGAVLSIFQALAVYAGLVESVDDDPHHNYQDQIAKSGGGIVVIVVVAGVIAAALKIFH